MSLFRRGSWNSRIGSGCWPAQRGEKFSSGDMLITGEHATDVGNLPFVIFR